MVASARSGARHDRLPATGLTDLTDVVLLPHLGSATMRVRDRMAELCAADAIAIAAGQLPRHCVDPEAWH